MHVGVRHELGQNVDGLFVHFADWLQLGASQRPLTATQLFLFFSEVVAFL